MNNKPLKNHGVIIILLVIMVGAAAFFVGSDLARAQGSGPGSSERDIGDQAPVPDEFSRAAGDLTPLYYFANVINNVGNEEGTAVICTNLDASETTTVEVQLYNWDGRAVGSDLYANLAPFRTATFESTEIDFYSADRSLFINSTIDQGYGRILTQHQNVVCTVQILDAVNNPPTWMENIPVWGHSGWGAYLPMLSN